MSKTKKLKNVPSKTVITALSLITLGLLLLQANTINAATFDLIENNPIEINDTKVKKKEKSSHDELSDSAVLSYLDLTPQEFIDLRRSGTSLTEFAKEEGYPIDELKEIIAAETSSKMYDAYESGKLSKKAYEYITTYKIDEIVNKRLFM
ncbi:MAG: hypothetical protein Q9M76_06865 [Candidatus Dojkabacteria bacterium]|nr:hypothetical protein [Candidatus Dojkabacteria bacterium]